MTLLRMRQAEFEAQSGVQDPDAWNVTAAASHVPIDVSRERTGNKFESALRRWRKQWVERVPLNPKQEQLRSTLPNHEFGRKARGWFEAWLNNWLGNRHVARAIIRYGFNSVVVVTDLMESIKKEKAEEAKKRKRQEEEEEHGAEEPMWKVKHRAHKARKAWREGRRLSIQIETGIIEWDSLSHDEQT